MLEFINITKKFKNNFWEKSFLALDDVSFKLNQGELVGFLGANGAGKTTLIKCLMNFSNQNSGEIKFSEILGTSKLEIMSNIGYLPERAYLYQHLTGREFLKLCGSLYSIAYPELNDLIRSWSEKMQIAHAIDNPIRSYSKGMQQRLGFISSIIHNPKLLILDEPLSGLDPIGRKDFKNILKDLNNNGVTIFFSSHIVADVEEICHGVVFIERGKLIYNGDIDSLLKSNSNPHYTLQVMRNGIWENITCTLENKEKIILEEIQNGSKIIEITKSKVSLEEIIYKIKR